jgi:hypothetical protein
MCTGVAGQEGQTSHVSAGWFCQDGRIPRGGLANFVIDSLYEVRYSGAFHLNPGQGDFEPGKI